MRGSGKRRLYRASQNDLVLEALQEGETLTWWRFDHIERVDARVSAGRRVARAQGLPALAAGQHRHLEGSAAMAETETGIKSERTCGGVLSARQLSKPHRRALKCNPSGRIGA